jgi:hypothetical protein
MLRIAFLFLVGQLAFSQFPQTSPAGQGAAAASIEGIVVAAGTNRPIAGVDVELSRVEGTENSPVEPRAEEYFRSFLNGGGAGGSEPAAVIASEVRYVTTGRDGRFSFTDLPEGKYRLVGSQGYARGDYYPAEYGQHDPRGRGLSFPVASGQAVRDLRLEMTLPGTIVGVVQDYDGEPMSYVGVLGLKVQYRDGRRILNLEQSVYTNERGEYRLYWLGPGQYHVAAVVQDPWRRTVRSDPIPPGRRGPTERASSPYVMSRILPTGEVIEESYAVVYNGGVVDPSAARVLEIQPGSLVNADIPMGGGRVRVSHIRGVVLDGTTARPAAGASVRAVPRQWSPNILLLDGTTGPDGSFDLAGAVPGSYDVFATAGTDSSNLSDLIATFGANVNISVLLNASGGNLVGYLPVETTGADLNGLTLTAVPGIGLEGRVSVEGEVTADIAAGVPGMRVGVTRDPDFIGTPLGMAPMPQPQAAPGAPPPPRIVNGQVDASGLFPLYVFPGQYRASVSGIPSDTYVKAIRLGATDVLANGLRITRPPDNALEVVLATDGGAISGRVVDDEGGFVPNAIVALAPDPVNLRQRPDLQQSVSADANGSFRIRNIPPGTYKLFAWRFVESGAWIDPAFRSRYETQGTLIYVEPDSQQQSELTVLPPP